MANANTTSATGGGADAVSAIAVAAGKLFDLVSTALRPGVLATEAYFQQLIDAAPQFRNPFEAMQQGQRDFNRTLLIVAGVIALALVLAIAFGKQSKT